LIIMFPIQWPLWGCTAKKPFAAWSIIQAFFNDLHLLKSFGSSTVWCLCEEINGNHVLFGSQTSVEICGSFRKYGFPRNHPL
jgi:hypothetical protein